MSDSRRVLMIMLSAMLFSACGGGTKLRPNDVSVSSSGSNDEEVGAVELDSHTDPRFYIANLRGRIGRIIPKGNQVFHNGKPIRKQEWLMNGGRVSTGANSGARIIFYRRVSRVPCVIQISQFKKGRLYGSSDEKSRSPCEHRVVTVHGESRVLKRSRYFMNVNRGMTNLLVKTGKVEAKPASDRMKKLTVTNNFSVQMMKRNYRPPVLLKQPQILNRTRWRENLKLETIQLQPLKPVKTLTPVQ